jgi:hypothetical protein
MSPNRPATLRGSGPGTWDAEYTIGNDDVIKSRVVYVSGNDTEQILKSRLGEILRVSPSDVHVYMAVKLGR